MKERGVKYNGTVTRIKNTIMPNEFDDYHRPKKNSVDRQRDAENVMDEEIGVILM